jgi:hypothetical protein
LLELVVQLTSSAWSVSFALMRPLLHVLCVALSAACSSEAVTSAPQPAPSSPVDEPAAMPGSTAMAGDGFAPIQPYPAAPYGQGVGAVIANQEFIGWRSPAAVGYDVEKLEHVKLGDYYDPTGAQTEIIVLNASAVWCTVCQAEMHDMQKSGTYEAFHQRKTEVIGTLFEDAAGDPAKPEDLKLWGASPSRLIAFPLVLDPALKMGPYFSADATPLNLIIDARTMKILVVAMGYDSTPGTGFWGQVDQALASRGL